MLPREARARAVSAGLALFSQGRRPIADGEVSEVRYGFEALPKAHSLGSGSNQIPSFLRNRSSSYLAVTDLTSPILAEALSIDRRRLLFSEVSVSDVGKPERETQNRVIRLFRDELHYRYLGDWSDRDGNSNIETYLLTPILTRSGLSANLCPNGSFLERLRIASPSGTRFGNIEIDW